MSTAAVLIDIEKAFDTTLPYYIGYPTCTLCLAYKFPAFIAPDDSSQPLQRPYRKLVKSSSCPISPRSILILVSHLLCLGLPSCLFLLDNVRWFPLSAHACYMPFLSHSFCFTRPNVVSRKILFSERSLYADIRCYKSRNLFYCRHRYIYNAVYVGWIRH
jgi:hypothetical protein